MAISMQVLYFHQHFNSPKGVVGIRSYQMAKALIRKGHSVKIVCGSYDGGVTGLTDPFINGCRRGMVNGIEVIEFDLPYSNNDSFFKRTLLFLKFSLRSIKLAFTEKYDLLFATSTPLTAGMPGIFAHWLRNKPFVFEVRDLWPELPKAMGVIRNPIILRLMSFLEWLTYYSADKLIGLSPGIVDGIAKRGVPCERIALIPNGCDLEIFDTPSEPWRPKEVSSEDLMAVFTGAHGVANGLDVVLDTALELKRHKRNDIKLVLIGKGKLKDLLKKRAQIEQLDNVIFHDPVSKEKLSGLLAAADLGMQILANVPAFYYGTSPNKFFDYIAAGLPVLNNYPGWLAEMIVKFQCGYVVPPDNPAAFAATLIQAADHRSELILMGQHARELARLEYNRDLLADRFVAWLEAAY